ncbi:sugar porter family MFS transporter [Paludibacterium yongneupense]|uniref:sugar porter family MFS transporter n=1 Tax=Paludibacterium yongneupense TaxID=400061 RepID=UPI000414906D|nr:sugar porter family MFS transporter [Paludibacterium yongneupense]
MVTPNTSSTALPLTRAPSSVNFQVACVGILAALAGLLFGLDIGVISGALPFIAATFRLGDVMQEWIVSSMMFGAALGAVGSGWLSFRLGRKKSLLLGAVLFVAGSALCALAWSANIMIAGRVVLGLAVGIASYTAPLYLSEIAPQRIRGAMISVYQLMITIGILVVYLSNTQLSASGNWRAMVGVVAVSAVLFLLGVLCLPDSPRWLVIRQRKAEARHVLQRLRGSDEQVEAELAEIESSLQVKQRGFQLFRENANFRRSVGLGLALQVMQQLTGINVIMYYAPRIFAEAGFHSTRDQMWCTVIVGLVNVLSTFIAIGFVDRWGRKPILYAGFFIMAAGMGAVAMMLGQTQLSVGEQYFTVAMLLLFILGFAMSAGPLIWVLCSEIQPLQGRDFGITCSTFTNWIANMIVGASFLSLLHGLGGAHTFWLYAGFNAAFIVVTRYFIPETRGVSLEQIEGKLMAGKALVDIGR